MKLYYHKTDGGAEYYSTTYIECENGHKEGTIEGVIMRTDGNEIEIFTSKLNELGIKLILN
jgi:hypothetical protein